MTLKNHPMRLLTDGFIVLLYRGEANTEGSHHKNASVSFRFVRIFRGTVGGTKKENCPL